MQDGAAPETCRNCGSKLNGPFCHACGQSAVHLRRPTRELLDDALGNVFQWDSRLIRTLKLLFFRPGQLSLEWIEGRRAHYVPPFRLYIIASFILFLLVGISTRSSTTQVEGIQMDEKSLSQMQTAIDEAEAEGARFTVFFLKGIQKAVEDPAGFWQKVLSNMPKAAFLLLPVFALLHMGVNLRHDRYYIDHLVFSLHFHAFAFFLLSLVFLLGLIYKPLGSIASWMNLFIPAYGVIGFRTFNQQGWGKSLLKAILAFGAYIIVLFIGVILFFGVLLVT